MPAARLLEMKRCPCSFDQVAALARSLKLKRLQTPDQAGNSRISPGAQFVECLPVDADKRVNLAEVERCKYSRVVSALVHQERPFACSAAEQNGLNANARGMRSAQVSRPDCETASSRERRPQLRPGQRGIGARPWHRGRGRRCDTESKGNGPPGWRAVC